MPDPYQPIYPGNWERLNEYLAELYTAADIQDVLDSVAHVELIPLALNAPRFTPFGQGYAEPAYRHTLNNTVYIQGLVACNPPLSEDDVGLQLSKLGDEALPSGRLLFGCPGNPGNNARFDIEPTGEIVFQGMLMGGGMMDWFSLSVIHFSVGSET